MHARLMFGPHEGEVDLSAKTTMRASGACSRTCLTISSTRPVFWLASIRTKAAFRSDL